MVKANYALSNSAQNVKSILCNSNRKCDLQNLAFFSKSASSVVFRSRWSVFLGPDHERSVRTVSASIFASTITTSGVLILLTGSPVATTLSCQDLTIRFFQLGCEAPFFIKIGVTTTTTGFVLGFASLLESSGPCSPPMEVSFFSGMPLLEMEFCGMDLLSTGYICLTTGGYLFQPGPQFPFQIQAFFKSRLFESISPSSPVSFCSTPAAKFYLCAPSRFLCVYLQVWSR